MLILPAGEHAQLADAAAYERCLRDAFPTLPAAAAARAAPQLAECPVSNGGTLTRCTKLASGKAVLVGDAGHSVYPALGQGANSALQAAAVLADTLRGAC